MYAFLQRLSARHAALTLAAAFLLPGCSSGGAMAIVAPPSGATALPVITNLALGGTAQGQVEVQGLGYYICVEGVYPTPSGSAPSAFFMGQVTLFAGSFAPAGWLPCDGRLLDISTNSALFSLLGTTYGGNGSTTFALPDLRARVPMGPH